MKFKLDENLPRELAEDLLRLGHDVDSVHGEGLVGAQDTAVVNAARAAGRILMTLDKGVASLARHSLQEHRGVVLIRPDASGRRKVLAFVRSRPSEPLRNETRRSVNCRRSDADSNPLERDENKQSGGHSHSLQTPPLIFIPKPLVSKTAWLQLQTGLWGAHRHPTPGPPPPPVRKRERSFLRR